jgi:CTP:molybdopterin cytidylyltransferase MocA
VKPLIVILAAGASTRMGSPKAFATFRGEALVTRAALIAAEVGEVVVVIGDLDVERTRRAAQGAAVVVNDAWRQGMSTSIAAGVERAAVGQVVCVWAVDQPLVTSDDLRKLCAAAASHETDGAAASLHAGRPGIPAAFAPSLTSRLLVLGGDSGARDFLRADANHVTVIDAIDARDADSPEQLETLESTDSVSG